MGLCIFCALLLAYSSMIDMYLQTPPALARSLPRPRLPSLRIDSYYSIGQFACLRFYPTTSIQVYLLDFAIYVSVRVLQKSLCPFIAHQLALQHDVDLLAVAVALRVLERSVFKQPVYIQHDLPSCHSLVCRFSRLGL